MALFLGLPGWAGTRKVKPIWILLKQETVSGSGISWAICKSAPCSRQITMPAPHHSLFYRPDALPVAQPAASKHWRPASPTVRWYRKFLLTNISVIIRSRPAAKCNLSYTDKTRSECKPVRESLHTPMYAQTYACTHTQRNRQVKNNACSSPYDRQRTHKK